MSSVKYDLKMLLFLTDNCLSNSKGKLIDLVQQNSGDFVPLRYRTRRLRTTTISYQETSYHSAREIVPHIDHIVKFVLMSYE